ncbi:MAG TPA: FAD/NAD(P)-binding protein [Solirubrobacteraceae bacterium]|nr:FAD/NAD(P)-binding protein [Solirubrobacteraceae bacterium]
MLEASREPVVSGPGPMLPEPFAVVNSRQETVDTWTLELEARSGRPFPFAPGQFTMLSAAGCGEVPISISGDPDRPGRLVHTVRAVGLATAAICTAEPGRTLGVRGPFGEPWPVEPAEGADVVIAAGGIGLAPLRPAILRLLARREHYGRLVLLYGARSPDQLLYPDELDAWQSRGLEVWVTVDSAGPEWLGHVGVVTRLARRARLDGVGWVAMSCGPEVMMRFTVAALRAAGVGEDRIFASMERNMQCGIGHCGHCQLGPSLVCRDGPVYRWSELEPWLTIREL